MKHPKWSKHSRLAALFSSGVATSIASAQAPVISIATGGAGRTPISTRQVSARIPGQYGASPATTGNANPLAPTNQPAIFEGPGSTDYLNFQNNFNLLANPQIAVGPEDILLAVNSQIFRVQNGNAPGVVPPMLYPAYAATAGPGLPNNTPNSFQRAFLDQWIGDVALGQLCPTGNPSGAGSPADPGNTRVSGITCLIENATVTYDQMHGRFLVLFTVTDTGLTFNPQCQGTLNVVAAVSSTMAATMLTCASTVIYNTGRFAGVGAAQVCYLPTSARLGVDNDTATIATACNAARWQNTTAFAPMFHIPANASPVREAFSINTLPYPEKLFVATTYPPLADSPLLNRA